MNLSAFSHFFSRRVTTNEGKIGVEGHYINRCHLCQHIPL